MWQKVRYVNESHRLLLSLLYVKQKSVHKYDPRVFISVKNSLVRKVSSFSVCAGQERRKEHHVDEIFSNIFSLRWRI